MKLYLITLALALFGALAPLSLGSAYTPSLNGCHDRVEAVISCIQVDRHVGV